MINMTREKIHIDNLKQLSSHTSFESPNVNVDVNTNVFPSRQLATAIITLLADYEHS